MSPERPAAAPDLAIQPGSAGADGPGARTRVTLVAGGKAGQREALIAAALVPGQSNAVILEGLADASSALAALAEGASAPGDGPDSQHAPRSQTKLASDASPDAEPGAEPGAESHAGAAPAAAALPGQPGIPPKVLPQITRIAPGCLCCAGNLVLRVTLNRLLRRPPAQLFISLADATHIEQLRVWLASPQYQLLLQPGPDLIAGQ